jgi:DNA-binding beta-propeller fold protein YncE
LPRRPRLALIAVALLLGGCGSQEAAELPPAATPAPSPPLSTEPAGRVAGIGGRPEAIAFDEKTGLVAIALPDWARIALSDPRTGRVRRTMPADAAPLGLRLALRGAARAGGKAFVADGRAGTVSVFAGGRRVARPRTGLQPGAVATAGGGRRVAVLDVRERVLDLLDARTLRRAGRATAGTGPTRAASDGGNYVYVLDTKVGALLIYRIVPELRLQRRYDLAGSPYGLAYDLEHRRIWVTLTATNELVELSVGARPRELRRFPTVAGPRGVAVDPASGRVFVTGTREGVLQLLDPPPLPRDR